jgi:hypothetical protein
MACPVLVCIVVSIYVQLFSFRPDILKLEDLLTPTGPRPRGSEERSTAGVATISSTPAAGSAAPITAQPPAVGVRDSPNLGPAPQIAGVAPQAVGPAPQAVGPAPRAVSPAPQPVDKAEVIAPVVAGPAPLHLGSIDSAGLVTESRRCPAQLTSDDLRDGDQVRVLAHTGVLNQVYIIRQQVGSQKAPQ